MFTVDVKKQKKKKTNCTRKLNPVHDIVDLTQVVISWALKRLMGFTQQLHVQFFSLLD